MQVETIKGSVASGKTTELLKTLQEFSFDPKEVVMITEDSKNNLMNLAKYNNLKVIPKHVYNILELYNSYEQMLEQIKLEVPEVKMVLIDSPAVNGMAYASAVNRIFGTDVKVIMSVQVPRRNGY